MFKLFIIALAALMAGCTQMSSRYARGTEYDRAVILYENGMLAEAREKARSITRKSPEYASARKLVADINVISMQLSRRHMEIGEDYERAGIFAKAAFEYSEALKFNPSNMIARQRLSFLNDAISSGERREHPDRKASAAPAKKTGRDEPEDFANTHYLKGKVYLESKAYAKAIDEFTAAIKIVPSYMNSRELLDRARAERDKAMDKHLMKGIAYFQSEQMELAIKEWDAVLELDPSNRVAADYKYRAEVILERLKKIREKQSATGAAS
ncbi:MAG TPA: hypothetical protein DDW94_07775 [Deltaproteobacteria bacterium]|nr:MAG: hypothetical protein A2Z79_02300 [Deltaproteobacteria bacterium GWA2_55_82]OGQ62650.1 MAG: hypothetical protein A3I81_09120 [Deltaproteobacteria bacterium RIFCSPLOWO2_02_FULL_55_12]OIJ74242.1 MAG: hypothetical protein A2V21_308200 [Deltaproteobacteria bacterium GWC2_55_46]HBG46871.1 hypothetical protein [Deltaproteobacteria bacterium]HCY11071.1 hypothetical protein [Deltaproteobacteria bacterium]